MVRPKSTQTKVVGMIIDKMHPYILFSSNDISMKYVQGCISSVIIHTTLVCVIFGPTNPNLLFQFISLLFIHVCIHLLSSIATESEGRGLVHSLYHEAMHRHGQVSSCIVYPRNSRAFVLHSLQHRCKCKLSATTNSGC